MQDFFSLGGGGGGGGGGDERNTGNKTYGGLFCLIEYSYMYMLYSESIEEN